MHQRRGGDICFFIKGKLSPYVTLSPKSMDLRKYKVNETEIYRSKEIKWTEKQCSYNGVRIVDLYQLRQSLSTQSISRFNAAKIWNISSSDLIELICN